MRQGNLQDFILKVPLESVYTIIVRLDFKALVADALQKIVTLQQKMMQSMSSQVDQYKFSGLINAASKAIVLREGEERGPYLNH